jgi:hypothetical protein
MKITAHHTRTRIISSLENNYHLPALSRNAIAHIKTLTNIQPELQPK